MQVKAIAPMPSFAVEGQKNAKEDAKRGKHDKPQKEQKAPEKNVPASQEAENPAASSASSTPAGQIVDTESMVDLLARSSDTDSVRAREHARQKYTAELKRRSSSKS